MSIAVCLQSRALTDVASANHSEWVSCLQHLVVGLSLCWWCLKGPCSRRTLILGWFLCDLMHFFSASVGLVAVLMIWAHHSCIFLWLFLWTCAWAMLFFLGLLIGSQDRDLLQFVAGDAPVVRKSFLQGGNIRLWAENFFHSRQNPALRLGYKLWWNNKNKNKNKREQWVDYIWYSWMGASTVVAVAGATWPTVMSYCQRWCLCPCALPPVGAAHVLFLWFTWFFFIDMAWCNGFCGQLSLLSFSWFVKLVWHHRRIESTTRMDKTPICSNCFWPWIAGLQYSAEAAPRLELKWKELYTLSQLSVTWLASSNGKACTTMVCIWYHSREPMRLLVCISSFFSLKAGDQQLLSVWLDCNLIGSWKFSRIICSCMASCVWRLLSLPLSWYPVSVLLLVCLAPPPNWVWHS